MRTGIWLSSASAMSLTHTQRQKGHNFSERHCSAPPLSPHVPLLFPLCPFVICARLQSSWLTIKVRTEASISKKRINCQLCFFFPFTGPSTVFPMPSLSKAFSSSLSVLLIHSSSSPPPQARGESVGIASLLLSAGSVNKLQNPPAPFSLS